MKRTEDQFILSTLIQDIPKEIILSTQRTRTQGGQVLKKQILKGTDIKVDPATWGTNWLGQFVIYTSEHRKQNDTRNNNVIDHE